MRPKHADFITLSRKIGKLSESGRYTLSGASSLDSRVRSRCGLEDYPSINKPIGVDLVQHMSVLMVLLEIESFSVVLSLRQGGTCFTRVCLSVSRISRITPKLQIKSLWTFMEWLDTHSL